MSTTFRKTEYNSYLRHNSHTTALFTKQQNSVLTMHDLVTNQHHTTNNMKIHMSSTKDYTQHNNGKKSLITYKTKSTIKIKEGDSITTNTDARSHLSEREMKSTYYAGISEPNDQATN